jgi:hypothetical protein
MQRTSDFTSTIDYCKKVQSDIFEIALGAIENRVNYVASFGNLIDSKNITDWIKIKDLFSINVSHFFFRVRKSSNIMFNFAFFPMISRMILLFRHLHPDVADYRLN